jgi:hypothetical protein
MPREARRFRIAFASQESADRRQVCLKAMEAVQLVPPRPRGKRVVDLTILPESERHVAEVARYHGANPVSSHPTRLWNPVELERVDAFVVEAATKAAPLAPVWESEEELDLRDACPRCKTGHRWKGTAQWEAKGRVRPLPAFAVTLSNGYLFSTEFKEHIESRFRNEVLFSPVVRGPPRRAPMAGRWAARGKVTLPACSAKSLMKRHATSDGCGECRRDAWGGPDDLGLVYEGAGAGLKGAAAETHECAGTARLPTATRPGTSALPRLVVNGALARHMREFGSRALRLSPVWMK